ncbi:MAG: MEKHLA domain-containing protein [Cyanobacteriota bacterium]|nr:MEKHLA domain-containing protein [Cyanobacteriota bacterium]
MTVELEPPWLQDPALEVVEWIVGSHRSAFGTPLLAGVAAGGPRRLAAQEVFAADRVVLAHDGGADPRLIYANAAALQLWKRSWREMVGLPSRLTAEPREREARAQALASARLREAMEGYGGIRVDSQGRRFRIEEARLWTLRDGQGQARGQAATFGRWWWLEGP